MRRAPGGHTQEGSHASTQHGESARVTRARRTPSAPLHLPNPTIPHLYLADLALAGWALRSLGCTAACGTAVARVLQLYRLHLLAALLMC